MFLFTNLFTADLLYRQIKNIVIILILLSSSIFAQTETEHWQQKKTDCKIIQHTEKDYSVDTSSLGITLLSGFVNTYYFLISDLDGDNCPFTPTCSNFFVQSVKETNIFQGILMFSDRFTRDLNFIEREKYPRTKEGRLIDLPQNYTLNEDEIVILRNKNSAESK